MKINSKTFDLPLFKWLDSLDKKLFFVIDETRLLFEYEYIKEKLENKTVIVHCRDAVAPFFTEKNQSTIDNLLKNHNSNNFVFTSVNYYPEFETFPYYFYFPEYHGYYYPMYSDSVLDDTVLHKKFLSLNKREDPSRQLLYVKFYHDNLLDSSYFSYLGEDNQYQNLYISAEWDNNWEILKSNIPEVYSWQIPTTRYKKIENDSKLKQYRGTNMHGTSDPTWMTDDHWYQTSFCSIVCETGPTAHKPNFSEKTFRTIMQGHPLILIGAKNSIKMLRELGFDMYDDIIDHSYDTISDCPFTRQIAAFSEIDKINSYSLNELLDIKRSLYSRRIKNIETYQQLYQTMLHKHEKIFEKIKDYVQSKI